ncbi:MAG: 16S rRNA (guanine(527)-N(7))-methyltransferase RsmG [Acidovorax sp.]|nr:16S rRNA (guanine(527)-N(7))-methyltransferase RsmG [Acidovorax sp.]
MSVAPLEAEAPAFGPEDFAAATGASPAQLADLHAFRAILEDWSTRMNLVGPSAKTDFWLRHAYDSAQLLQTPQGQAKVWADLGAGAGFPGVVLAIMLTGVPGAQVHLVESMTKRCRFLGEAVRALGLPATVHNVRAESLRLTGIEVVTARACAPLPRLLGYAEPLMKAGARGLFLKGRGVEAEVSEARNSWRFKAEMLPSRSDPSGVLLAVEGLRRA